MRYETLLEPISDDAPCGPDLEAEGDDDFIDYYYEALANLPTRFVDLTSGEIFDRKSIDIRAQVSKIEGLLQRSVDLRLLVLEAQFQALSGTLQGFAECVNAIAQLLKERWGDVHPQVSGGVTERKNVLELLNTPATVVMPLEHLTLLRDRRLDAITYRSFQVASGQKDPRQDERPGDAGAIQAAMRSADNAEAIEAAYTLLSTVQSAVKTISTCCKTADSNAFAPTLGNIEGIVAELVAFVGAARPDLGTDEAAGEPDEDGTGEAAGSAPGEGGAPAVAVAAAPAGPVASHAAATAALLSVEAYFSRTEPSAPGLLLIRQARKLVGRPLTEALDTLLPSVADYAVIDFGSETGFKMDIYKLRELAGDTYDVDALPAEEPEVPEYRASSRSEALGLISAVESFFRQVEPSSPVPVLLFKAKNYMNRDFSAIVTELLAHREQS